MTVGEIIEAPCPRLPRRREHGLCEIDLELKVVTPIFGGGPILRDVDRIDVIRTPSIRGHLRFWWRALHAQEYDNAQALYLAESKLWGGPAGEHEGIGRSPVELRVDRIESAKIQDAELKDERGYATFPGRAQSDGTPAAKLRWSGTRFRLRLRFPNTHEPAVLDALRAWLLFGGYGGRTRRGLGCLTVLGDPGRFLPKQPNKASINKIFGRDIFTKSERVGQTPLLAGAQLFSSYKRCGADDAWRKAIGWLFTFRQGHEHQNGARRPGSDKRPSYSNWPEADKVRHLSKAALPWAHKPRYDATPAWPRAGFGLPIIGQFQEKARNKKRWEEQDPPRTEPEGFRIGWRPRGASKANERLASPLILKPLPLLHESKEIFSPIALWLERAHPEGELVLQRENGTIVEGSAAPFEQFLAPEDDIEFTDLADHDNLRDAFYAWLRDTQLEGQSGARNAGGKSGRKPRKRGRR